MPDATVKQPRKKTHDFGDVVFYNDDTILLKNVRCSYPHLGEPSSFKDKDGKDTPPRFSMKGLMPKEPSREKGIEALNKRIKRIMREAKIEKLKPDNKCLRDGDNSDKKEDEDTWTITASEAAKNPPILRGKRKETISPEKAARVFYGGCWVNVLIKMWGQNNNYGKRVNANLCAVQFVKDDEPFGEGRISEDDADNSFEDIGDGGSGYDEEDDDDL